MWLGVFFTTSVRFLTASYLKRGKVEDIAKAAVRRIPRLMIPVATIALLEYFVIDCGATKYLQYVPSISWSTWAYVMRYDNFGQYISNILELIFLIPNAVPQITFNYCTGVLWTIAVQLQGTWIVLLGVMVISEITTTWKRVMFYMFCFISHWYAQSWGAYLWFGLLLTDLDITFKYKKWLYSHQMAYYPLIIFCWICVAAGFAANLLPSWAHFNFSIFENGLHPDPWTGEPTRYTDRAGYPPYYTPRLNGLLFAGGMQAIVELSTTVQWLLSTKPLLILFPHIFTIYLMHGVVFWSWGSWLMVFLAERDFSYSVNVAIVGVTSYAVLILLLPVITPVIEALGKDVTAMVWMTAQETPPPRRRTLFPFPSDIIIGRELEYENADGNTDIEAKSGRTGSIKSAWRSLIRSESGSSGKKRSVHRLSDNEHSRSKATEQPDVQQSASERSTPERPTTEQATTEQATTEQPAAKEHDAEDHAAEEPTSEEPTAKEPQTTVQEPTTEQSTVEGPTTEQAIVEELAVEEPTTEELVAE